MQNVSKSLSSGSCPERGHHSINLYVNPAQNAEWNLVNFPFPLMNLSAKKKHSLNEEMLISLTEEQLEQLRITWTNVCRHVLACLCHILAFCVATTFIPSSAPQTYNHASHLLNSQMSLYFLAPTMDLFCRAADNFQALCLVLSQCLRTPFPASSDENKRKLHALECMSMIFHHVVWQTCCS